MTLRPPLGREDYRLDLTRWNRAGLTRFRYVDGNAAVWLEELRIGFLAQYLRGIDPEDREPEKWRDLYTKLPADWQLTSTIPFYENAVAWADILPPQPANAETGGTRNRRLVDQYDRKSPDYAWEIARAFARAAHVLLGHLDAYANEGYLRTATQWDNLRKLAAMVNYQPTPPASATTTVALVMNPDTGVIEVARGLAMKFAPPEGGAPLIFETLKPVDVHPDLNAARAVKWNENRTPIDISDATDWIVPKKAALAQGDLAVLASWEMFGSAHTIVTVERDEEAEIATLVFDPAAGATTPMFEASLFTEPADVRLGLPESAAAQLVFKLVGGGSVPSDTIVEVRYGTGFSQTMRAVVVSASGNELVVAAPNQASGAVKVEPYTPFAPGSSGAIETPTDISTLYFKEAGGSPEAIIAHARDDVRQYDEDDGTFDIASVFNAPAGSTGPGFAKLAGNRTFDGEVVSAPSWANVTLGFAVRFEGKPPKGLEQGDWYVARPVGSIELTALKVVGVRVEADVYYVLFCPEPPADPERTEFFGPMARQLRPVDYDRSPDPAIVGGECELTGLSQAARDLVKPGKTVLVVHERDGVWKAGQAAIVTAEPIGTGNVKLTLDSETDFTGWEKGWTTFHLNTVTVSHGETKDPKVLGSGDAERRRQDFRFKIDTVSFIPSTASVTGVVPDMDVAVDGVKWEYRDLGDPTAEETDAWSVKLNEDDTLQVHFRRRLPTGTHNVTVPRHRVGVGLAGNIVPSWAFATPMKKNRFVSAIVQPFPASGGSDREPVSAMRENAPANLAANGRAVSLKDFERLCRRHTSVWQAKARKVVGPGATNHVDIIVVPSGGGAVTTQLSEDLIDFVQSRALPGVVVTISGYEAILVAISVTIYVDTGRYEKTDVQDSVLAALFAEFDLVRRGLGQPLYVAEILAAVERVEGVETVVINSFARKAGAPQPLREAVMSGALAAIFPRDDQVVHVGATADIVVLAEAAS